ncbi:MAG: type II/IV secretion system ATPase subunit [Thermoplasmata archaeon]
MAAAKKVTYTPPKTAMPAKPSAPTAVDKILSASEKKRKLLAEQVTVAERITLEDYEELESYPVWEPYVYVKVLSHKREHTKRYYVVEPEVSEDERRAIHIIEDVLVRALNIKIDDLKEEPEAYLRNATTAIINSYALPILHEAEDRIFYFIKRDLMGYGPIDPLMNDPQIEDVSCDGPSLSIYIYHRKYESIETNISWANEAVLESYVIRLAQRCGKHISVAEPLLDATLMDGSRVVMTLGRDISTRGSTFTIRKFKEDPFTPPNLIEFKTFSSLMLAYIWLAVQYGMSMLYVGGTASGKTTSLNACSLFIPRDAKVVSIEETREINLPHPNWIPGATREGFGGEGMKAGGKMAGEVDMYDLLKAALRQRPEYIIVGEIRGPEAYVLFQAMATGHTTYSTVHADSVPSLIHRLENKPIDIPRVMLPSLDAISIQIQTRIGERRVRRVKQLVEIIGMDPHTQELLTNEAFRWSPATDEYEFYGKSYVLENIMVMSNMSKSQITMELRTRQEILEWLVENDVMDISRVARVINQYYSRPEEVRKLITGEMNLGDLIGAEAAASAADREKKAAPPPVPRQVAPAPAPKPPEVNFGGEVSSWGEG